MTGCETNADPLVGLGDRTLEVKETHISRVLIGRERVLKLKKPVDFGFLDYTTLLMRKQACEAEVRLNSRISPEVYLGVEPIRDTSGVVVDYGVLMRRLPADRMLDELVKAGQATEAMIARAGGRLAAFHAEARRGPEVDAFGSLAVLRRNWEENFEQTAPYVGRTISADAFARIRAWVNTRLETDRARFEARVAEGRIVDGHGDLRAESICVVNGMHFFDCIEFNDRFRCGDVAGEIAFLAMDLDSLGRPDLGYNAVENYAGRSRDAGLWPLLPFYRCYRAYVRGKVLSFRLDQEGLSAEQKERAASRAASYFALAARYADRLERRAVILVGGRSGTGKTTIARAIASELGLRVVSTDAVRESVFGERKAAAGFGEGVYTPEAKARVYDAMMERAAALLAEDGAVILDATFLHAADRARARSLGAAVHAIECRVDADEAHCRMDRRAAQGEGKSDATWDVYLRQQFEPPSSEECASWLTVDTGVPLAQCARDAAAWLRRQCAGC